MSAKGKGGAKKDPPNGKKNVKLAFDCAKKALNILDTVMEETDFGHVKYSDIQAVRDLVAEAQDSLEQAAKKNDAAGEGGEGPVAAGDNGEPAGDGEAGEAGGNDGE